MHIHTQVEYLDVHLGLGLLTIHMCSIYLATLMQLNSQNICGPSMRKQGLCAQNSPVQFLVAIATYIDISVLFTYVHNNYVTQDL